MLKSLALQAELTEAFGACLFDVTLDCADGAPLVALHDHGFMVTALSDKELVAIKSDFSACRPWIAVGVPPVDHPAFEDDGVTTVGRLEAMPSQVTLPKVASLNDTERAVALIESPAVQHASAMAASPKVQSHSFGLMDFALSQAGAIPASALACQAAGKVSSRGVVTEFKDPLAVQAAARFASRVLGYSRMWHIHPDPIRPILAAFAPPAHALAQARANVVAAQAVDWTPIAV